MTVSTELYHGVNDVIARMIWANRLLGTDPTFWETATADLTGTHGWPVFSFGEPDIPDNVITVYETTPQFDAKLMVTGEVMEHHGFTVRVRGKGPTMNVARRRAEQIRADFNSLGCTDQVVTMADGTQYFIPCVSRASLVPVGRDAASSQRWLVNINCLAAIRRKTA